MDDNAFETTPITITDDDIVEANQLSLHCPICAGAVEANVTIEPMAPIICGNCETLYHKACWEQNGGTCAVLGCDHKEYYRYGTNAGPALVITERDIAKLGPRPSVNGNEELKRKQREQHRQQRRSFWTQLFERLLRAIKILD